MPDAGMKRRLASMISARVADAGFDEVRDGRDARGKRWALPTLLTAAVASIAAGATSFREAERVTAGLPGAGRRWLGIARRVPDTTLRDALGRTLPEDVRRCLHRVVGRAHRRKALVPDAALPFGVVSLDGKAFSLPSCDDFYAQRQTAGEGAPLVGVVRTITATLTSSAARPCIDASPIPASTNEMGAFRRALAELVATYGSKDLFRLVTYDAGACSLDNATAVREANLHYLFAVKGCQSTLLDLVRRQLAELPATAAASVTEERVGNHRVVRRLYRAVAMDAPEAWTHLRTLLRVETETLDARGHRVTHDDRYFISSLAADRLVAAQWALIVRRHWGVETTHQILDVSFREDDHPWVESEPRTALVVALLRRIAYTMLALFRGVTQRSDARRAGSWRELLADVRDTLLLLADVHLQGLRKRSPRLLPAPG